MENPTTITINSHKIRTITRNEKRWYHQADVKKALDADISNLSKDDKNVATGSEINDPGQVLVAIISESALHKLTPAEPTKDEQISILKNQINILEELLMDGAGPMKAFPVPARQTEATESTNQLDAINRMHPAIVEDTLIYAQNLLLNALGITHLDALKETMTELSDNHPQAYHQLVRRIDINHDFIFDTGETLSPSYHWVS